jgi:hypothetical protein
MIKAIILDVDGVIKGSLEGINFPLPHTEVLAAMKKINKQGIPVILCTGNYYYSIIKIIKLAELRSPHITDRAALIVDTFKKTFLEKHTISGRAVKNIIEALWPLQSYLEVFSSENYYIQKNKISAFEKKRHAILQKDPVVVDSAEEIPTKDIIKISLFTKNQKEKDLVNKTLEKFNNVIAATWTYNPAIGDVEIVDINAKDVTKVHAAKLIIKKLGLTFDSVLGVGDAFSDWEFMSLCKYVAAMGNAKDEFKELVKSKGKGNYFIAPHVDENGILEVFKHFGLLK